MDERRFMFGDHALPTDEGEPTSLVPPGQPSLPPQAAASVPPQGVERAVSPSVAPSSAVPAPIGRGRGTLSSIPFRRRSRWPWIALSWAVAGAMAAYAIWAIRKRDRARALLEASRASSVRESRKAPRSYDPGRPAENLTECVTSYFPKDSFAADIKLDLVCDDRDFRDITRQLHKLASAEPDAGPGLVPDSPEGDGGLVVTSPLARRTWELGWYELAATAVIRAGCCRTPRPIDLPATRGWCPQLEKVVRQVAEDSQKPMDLAPTVKMFDEAVTCLFANAIERPYDYLTPPTDQNRGTFQQFLKKAAESDARRSGR